MMVVYSDACKKDRHIGLGWQIERDGDTIVTGNEYLKGDFTSVGAEFMALIRAMRSALRYKEDYITFYTDCLPVVTHIDNDNPIKDGRYLQCIDAYDRKLDNYMIMWTPRDNNDVADREAHVAIDEALT
jgi:ribonuclease HI